MSEPIYLPLWLLIILATFALIAFWDRFLMPGVRWYFQRKTHHVLNTLNTRLKIEIQPFKLTKRQSLIDRLTYDSAVLEAMKTWAHEKNASKKEAMDRVKTYAREIVPSFNAYLYFRIAYWLAKKFTQSIYRVRLGYADDEALSKLPPKASIVFIINHRSNMDYILLTYFAASHTALSYAVGEWARIWPLQSFVRAMGAYFVRRNSHNPLYRKVLERYVQIATAEGVTQAVFMEGGLSRDGKLRAPKLGLLDYLLRSFDPTNNRDLVFIPVGLNYDRTLEDRTLLLDTGKDIPKKGKLATIFTTMGFLASNIRLMFKGEWRRFGYACVNFGPPVSTKAWLKERNVDLREMEGKSRIQEVGALAEQLMDQVGAMVPVLPVSLVSLALLEEKGQWVDALQLKASVFEHMERLKKDNAHIYIPRKDMDYAIVAGLRMLTLRRLVEEGNQLYKVAAGQEHVLRYYANALSHFPSSKTTLDGK